MRLTLRTLLAYLDDTLPPDQAREIGEKVAESHVAQELMERIKKVTRRRGLTVPPAAGPERIDANTVAEYLDNDLPSDRVAEVEELALNSDVHLAEIAACHQILTLVLGEPAHVPPTARERMYGLVTGKESEPHRRASRIGPPAFPGEVESAEDLRAARRGVGYRLLGAAVLGVALAVAVWQALPGRQQQPKPTPKVDEIVDATPHATPETKATTPAPAPEVKPPEKSATPPTPPAPPPMPEKTEPVTPPAPPAPPPDRSANTEKKDVGQFMGKDAVLLASDGKAWTKVAADAKVRSTTPLLAFPGSHDEIKLDTGARLTLWGGLPDTTGWKALDCLVTPFVPPAGFDLDFAIDRGRVYVSSAKTPAAPSKVRVRFGDQVWDLTLAEEPTEVMIEVSRLFAGEPFQKTGTGEAPRTEVTLAILTGKVTVSIDGKETALQSPPGPARLSWDSKAGLGKPVEEDAAPLVWAKAPTKLSRERAQEIAGAQQKLVQRVGTKDKPIDLAVAEVAQDTSRAARVLAVLCQGTLGQETPLLDALDEPQFPEVRQAAAAALAHFAARQPGNDRPLAEQLARKGYGQRQAEQAGRLLHGFSDAQLAEPATYEFLIDALKSDQPGVRELAAWRLRQVDPDGSAAIRFNAADPEGIRERAVAEWQRRIPAGKLPPRTTPQGRATGRTPTSG